MKKKTMATIALALLATTSLVGVSAEAIDPYDEFVEHVAQLSELLDRAAYLSISGLSSYNSEDKMVIARSLVNLYEGKDGPNYASLDTGEIADDIGIIRLYALLSEDLAVDCPDAQPGSVACAISDVLDVGAKLIQAGYAAALQALTVLERDGELEDAFLSAYAFVATARGGFDDPMLIGSLERLAEMIPPKEIWVAADESIQDAINRIRENGTVYLSPGTYSEVIVISKSMNLVAASHSPNGLPELGSSILKGQPWRGARPFDGTIEIVSEESIEVVIRGLIIRSSGGGMTVKGASDVRLVDVNFENNEIGLWVSDGGVVSAEACRFSENEQAMTVVWGGECSLRECTVERSARKNYAVAVLCSRLELIDSRISDNPGGGIGVGGGSVTELHMVDNEIIRNAYGVRVNMTACELKPPLADSWLDTPMSDYAFPTVSGWGNAIPGPEEEDGNSLQAFDIWAHRVEPIDLTFLLEPKPEGE